MTEGGVSARFGVDSGDGIGEIRLTSLLLSNTAAAASSHVGIGGSCFTGDGHGVAASVGVGGVVHAVGDCCRGVGMSSDMGVVDVGIDKSRLSSLLLLLKTMFAVSSHVGIGGSVFAGGGCVGMVVVGDFWAVVGC